MCGYEIAVGFCCPKHIGKEAILNPIGMWKQLKVLFIWYSFGWLIMD